MNKQMFFWVLAVATVVFIFVPFYNKKTNQQFSLLLAEQQTVNNKIYDVGFAIDVKPLSFIKDGIETGISIETLKVIQRKSGLRFNYVRYETQSDVIKALEFGQIDIATTVMNITEHQHRMKYTFPYKHARTIMLIRNPPISFPMIIGYGLDYAVEPTLKLLSGQVELKSFDRNHQAFISLKGGEIGAAVMDEFSAKYLEDEYKIQFNRREVNFHYELSFGVQNSENTELLDLLDRAIFSLSKAEKAEIMIRSGIN